ncbi:integrin alpha-IIb-like [Pectinophora gossypiella]|uniref:integrin alpha-IIb-like n=1 Tax=Pectinophora gossypiella TaxID=13191 RepID=UPI00214EE94F|nr:integrin alpha-IIb-like [Pectinophora gossypiella]
MMAVNILGRILVLALMLTIVGSLYYHEPSHIEIKPSLEEISNTTDFGFSLAYQPGAKPQLVVGAPHYDLVGRVYGCPMAQIFKKSQECSKLDIDLLALASDYEKNNTKQPFCLGGTVAATKDYVFTCAPLWTTVVSIRSGYKVGGSYGTCFVYYNQTSVQRFRGLLEQTRGRNYPNIYGGVGWSSIVEETSQLLVGKPAVRGDIQYVSAAHPLSDTVSVAIQSRLEQSQQVGYALAFGKFFSNIHSLLYAFSFRDEEKGQVGFLQYDQKNSKMNLVKYQGENNIRYEVIVSSPVAMNMFGAALGACDINGDGVTDLIVGAPAHTSYETSYDAGAIYIYLGGDLTTLTNPFGKINDYKMTIVSDKDGARFGTSIASSDIDGDALSEIFVSAPYEDSAVGALYILSGFELTRIMKKSKTTDLYLSNLKLTQRIQKADFRSYGYSLQVVSDVDKNGCDELAVGAPGSASVDFFRCVPAINVSLSTEPINTIVKEYDSHFEVKVCVTVSYHSKPANITTKLSVLSEVVGNSAEIKKPRFDVPLEHRKGRYCENVVVNFMYNESGLYTFSSKLESDIDKQLKLKDFDPGWVQMSVYSKREDSVEVTRQCSDVNDCTPRLEMHLLWAGSEDTTEWPLSVNTVQNVTVLVENKGANAYDACVRVRMSGARVLNVACGLDDTGAYKCYLPKPLTRGQKYPLKIIVSLDEVTNNDDGFHIVAALSNNCNSGNASIVQKHIKYQFPTDNIKVTGHPHTLDVTETTLQDKKNPLTDDRHKYSIVNSGSVHWKNIKVVVTIVKRDFIQNYTATTTAVNSQCTTTVGDEVHFNCTVDLIPQIPVSIIISVEIVNSKIFGNLVDDKLLITSNISVPLKPTSTVISKSQTSTINFVKELSLKNNKAVIIIIAIIVAIVIMCLLMYILFRMGFFQRKEKQRLDSLKESVKSKGSKPSTSETAKEGRKESKEEDNMDDFEIEIIEDCPFDPTPVRTSSTANLVVEKAS